ncbi:MAG: hypothetical protein Q7W51_00690 [Coriobacteriia bacterium]|nr:hypothetical protein [Coriobacteriia bacterium]
MAALLVGVLTVLAPDGAMSALHANDSVGARSGAASAVGAVAAGYVEPAVGASSAPVSPSALSGAVTVTVTVRDPFVPVPTIVPIYRFFSRKSGTHFYTPSAEERDIVIARWPDVWQYEGIAYTVNPARNTQPLHRFYNRANGSHFYTSSPTERDMVLGRWMNVFQYDGASYPVTPYAEAGKAPVWRFFNLKNGSHFYTASAEEADHVIANWPDIYQLEGVAFWLGQ